MVTSWNVQVVVAPAETNVRSRLVAVVVASVAEVKGTTCGTPEAAMPVLPPLMSTAVPARVPDAPRVRTVALMVRLNGMAVPVVAETAKAIAATEASPVVPSTPARMENVGTLAAEAVQVPSATMRIFDPAASVVPPTSPPSVARSVAVLLMPADAVVMPVSMICLPSRGCLWSLRAAVVAAPTVPASLGADAAGAVASKASSVASLRMGVSATPGPAAVPSAMLGVANASRACW